MRASLLVQGRGLPKQGPTRSFSGCSRKGGERRGRSIFGALPRRKTALSLFLMLFAPGKLTPARRQRRRHGKEELPAHTLAH